MMIPNNIPYFYQTIYCLVKKVIRMPYRLKIGDVILVHDHHFASDLVMWGEEIELLRTGESGLPTGSIHTLPFTLATR